MSELFFRIKAVVTAVTILFCIFFNISTRAETTLFLQCYSGKLTCISTYLSGFLCILLCEVWKVVITTC